MGNGQANTLSVGCCSGAAQSNTKTIKLRSQFPHAPSARYSPRVRDGTGENRPTTKADWGKGTERCRLDAASLHAEGGYYAYGKRGPKHPVLRCTWDAMPKNPQFLGHARTRSRVRLSREVDARSPQAPTLSASPTAAYPNMRSKLSSATCVNSLVPISAGLAAPRTCRTHSRRSATCA